MQAVPWASLPSGSVQACAVVEAMQILNRSYLGRVATRIKTEAYRFHHSRAATGVLATAPLHRGSLRCAVLSMVSRSDVLAYLVAVKSFCHFAPAERIVVLCDRSITQQDRDVIATHVPFVEFLHVKDYVVANLPVGGCWERLHALASLAADAFVVQLDSDTVTTAPVEEVLRAVHNRAAFMMGVESDQRFLSMAAMRKRTDSHAEKLSTSHIHDVVEYFLPRLGYDDSFLYTTGWAAFSAFPPDRSMLLQLFDLVARLRSVVGVRLDEWGSEMVASNFLASNAARCHVLPFPKYSTPLTPEPNVHLAHFVGSHRFRNNRYASQTQRAIQVLLKERKL